MGLANRSTPAFLMALVALWAPPARCADAPAADATAAPTVGDFSFIDEIRGGVFYDKHREETGILASPEVLSSQLPFYNGSNPFWLPSSNRDSLPARWSASKAAPAMLRRV